MMAATTPPVFKLTPTVQCYDWGKLGLASKVAQFAVAAPVPGFELDENAPYAELWMGTHPSAPSRLADGDGSTTLQAHLAAHPALLGAGVCARFATAKAGSVPFLLKVLAIRTALSIQTHPDKPTAEALHAAQPHIYKDDNHKPEMAIALTPFTALCGFRPLPAIAAALSSTPELAALVPPAISTRFVAASASSSSDPEAKAALRDVFGAVMAAPADAVQAQLGALVARYKAGGRKEGEDDELARLALTLDEQFPGDVGVFCAFLLNYIKLAPGEAIYLGAGEPHAYVSGDIIECMATSDNVIRAGLTPKLRDVPNLLAGLTYAAGDPAQHTVRPTPFSAPSPPAPSANASRPSDASSLLGLSFSYERDANGKIVRISEAPSQPPPPAPPEGFPSAPDDTPPSASASASAPAPAPSMLYDPPAPEFAVVRLALAGAARAAHRAVDGPSVAVVTEGTGAVRWGAEGVPEEGTVEVATGQVFFVGAGTEVRFESGEEGLVLFRAFVEP